MMFFSSAIAYLEFLWRSTNEHGVHSPFVFKFVTKCIYDKAPKSEYHTLSQYRQELLRNSNCIEVTDFGAGSRVFKSNLRSIAKIARTAGISEKRAALLFRLTRYFQPENVLEIGTSVGLATVAMAVANPKSKITTLEGCPETARIANENFKKFNLTNVSSEITEFENYLKKPTTNNYQLIYFDGNHSEQATLAYFELLLPTVTHDSVWIFDDIHWSKEMTKTWLQIKNHPKVKVTIDTFQWGLVFFRKEQEKEHFTIRI